MANEIIKKSKLFFLISTKDTDGEIISDTVSIQEMEERNELYQKVLTMDSNGQHTESLLPLIAVNYSTSVDSCNPFRNYATITITRKTKQGNIDTSLYLEEDKCTVYEDENVKVVCGVAELDELPKNATPSQTHYVYDSVSQKLSNIIGYRVNFVSNNSTPSEPEM